MTDLMGAIVGLFLLTSILYLGVYLWYAFALSKVFPRLGAEGWKAWVPILNEAELLARGGVPAWSVVYYFIPVLQFYGLYLKVIALSRINAQFGYGAGMTVLGLLLSPVWASVLAWGAPRTAPAFDERVASMLPAAGVATGPLASPDLPTFVTHEEFAAVDEPEDIVDASAAPTVIHNPWAPTSPADAPTPEVAIPAAIVPPVASVPEAVRAVAAPPTAIPADAPPAAVVEPVLSAPPIAVEMPSEPEPVVELAPAPEPEPELSPEPTPPVAVDEEEDGEDEYASTVVVDRRPEVRWALLLDDGRSFPLVAEKVEVGRKPEGTDPTTQYLPISDTTRTLSKTHARLELSDGQWSVVDLNSTNGVVTIGEGEVENLLAAGGTVTIPDRFILGKVGMRVMFEEGAIS
jgi:hypothetical protein